MVMMQIEFGNKKMKWRMRMKEMKKYLKNKKENANDNVANKSII